MRPFLPGTLHILDNVNRHHTDDSIRIRPGRFQCHHPTHGVADDYRFIYPQLIHYRSDIPGKGGHGPFRSVTA